MKNPEASLDQQTLEELAYQIYLQEGRPDGKAEEHWHQAEAMLAQRSFEGTKQEAEDQSSV